jgi:hypothetical protein
MRFAALPPILVGVLTGGVYVVFRADTLTAGSGGTAAGVYYELTARRSLAARRSRVRNLTITELNIQGS